MTHVDKISTNTRANDLLTLNQKKILSKLLWNCFKLHNCQISISIGEKFGHDIDFATLEQSLKACSLTFDFLPLNLKIPFFFITTKLS